MQAFMTETFPPSTYKNYKKESVDSFVKSRAMTIKHLRIFSYSLVLSTLLNACSLVLSEGVKILLNSVIISNNYPRNLLTFPDTQCIYSSKINNKSEG